LKFGTNREDVYDVFDESKYCSHFCKQEAVALPVNSVTDSALNLNPDGTPSLMGNLPKEQEPVAPPAKGATDTALNLNPDETPLTYRTAKSGPNRDNGKTPKMPKSVA